VYDTAFSTARTGNLKGGKKLAGEVFLSSPKKKKAAQLLGRCTQRGEGKRKKTPIQQRAVCKRQDARRRLTPEKRKKKLEGALSSEEDPKGEGDFLLLVQAVRDKIKADDIPLQRQEGKSTTEKGPWSVAHRPPRKRGKKRKVAREKGKKKMVHTSPLPWRRKPEGESRPLLRCAKLKKEGWRLLPCNRKTKKKGGGKKKKRETLSSYPPKKGKGKEKRNLLASGKKKKRRKNWNRLTLYFPLVCGKTERGLSC